MAGHKCRKIRYRDKISAVINAKRQKKWSGYMNAYHCYRCHGWHLGHPRGTKPWPLG